MCPCSRETSRRKKERKKKALNRPGRGGTMPPTVLSIAENSGLLKFLYATVLRR